MRIGRWAILVIALVACGRAPLDIDRTAVTAKSHAFLAAFDRRDAKVVEPMLGRSF